MPYLAFRLRDLKTAQPQRFGWLPQPLRWGDNRYKLPSKPIDWLFQTNNYGVTHRFVTNGYDLGSVVDHVHATSYFTERRLPIRTFQKRVLSVTNKHPCSATHIVQAAQGANPRRAIRAWVERFVIHGRQQQVPEDLAWIRPLLDQTLDLFEAVLKQ